jgi:PAS domain S-box-containing protein
MLPSSTRTTVLLLSEHEADRTLVDGLLSQAGSDRFELDWIATPGATGRALAGADVCLLDQHFDGSYAFIREQVSRRSRVPIILLADEDDQAVDQQAWQAGAADCLVKARLDAAVLGRSISRAVEHARAVDALRESERRFREMADSLPQTVFETDERGFLTFANRRAFELWGHSDEDFARGLHAADVFAPEERERLLDLFQHALAGGDVSGLEWTARRKDGTRFPVIVHSRPIVRQGRPVGLRGIIIDSTEQKRTEAALRESERRFRELADSLPQTVFEVDPTGRVTYVNRIAFEQWGYTREDLERGINVIDLVIREQRDRVRASIETIMRGGQAGGEYTVVRRDGTRVPVVIHSGPIVRDGHAVGVRGILVDISHQKRTEEALRASEERYRQLFERNLAGVYRSTSEGEFLDCNEAFVRMFGYDSREEIFARRSQELYLDPLDREEFLATLHEKGSVRNFETFRRRKDGSVLCALQNAVLLPGEPGEPDLIEGAMIDITERQRTVEALRDSEQRYRYLFQSNPHPMAVYDVETLAILAVNDATVEHYGYSRDEFLRMSITELSVSEQVPAVMRRVVELGQQLNLGEQWRHRRRDGSVIDVEISSHALIFGGRRARLITINDITERKRAEEALRASEAELRALFAAMTDVILVFDREGRYVKIAPTNPSLLYRPAHGLLGQTVYEVFPREQAEFFHRAVQRALDAGGTINIEYGLPIGETDHWFSANLSPVSDDSVIVVIRDVTERKRSEEALIRSEARYRSLVENAAYGIYRTTLDGQFLAVNPALAAMLGYESGDELLELGISSLYRDPAERDRLIERYRQARKIDGVEVEWKRRDGTPIIVRLSGRTVQDEPDALQGFEMIVEDITERRSLENQFRQSQKMEAVGRLAGGVAHDFNNLLTAMLGYADLLGEQFSNDDPRQRDLEEIRRAAERAAALTRQLLAFSRKQVLQPRPLDLSAIVGGIEKMLRRLIGEDVQLVTRSGEGLGRIKADAGQIEQVIMNLAVNARDAMPNGGLLTIETDNIELDENYARTHPSVTPGQYVMLGVSDNGCGMDAEVKWHLFEPFFTTKERGRGTGLGLATVYGIVQQSGGHISVYSEPGLGTTFRIYFPRLAQDAAEAAESSVAVRAEPPRGSETVLLVEDEDAVRTLAHEVLHRQGYRVIPARNGADAIQQSEQATAPIHLLVTDIVMPGISGRELVKMLAPVRPDMKVLYISGYSDHTLVAPGAEAAAAFLQKPFTPDRLARAVRRALDTTPPAGSAPR